MRFCYEAFLRWLTLWLPEGTTLYDHLCDSSYEGLVGEFWAAIAFPRVNTSPWGMRYRLLNDPLYELMEGTDDLKTLKIWLEIENQES